MGSYSEIVSIDTHMRNGFWEALNIPDRRERIERARPVAA